MKFKHMLIIFVSLLLLILIPKTTFAQENLIKKDYINDYANIIEEKNEKELNNEIKKYIKKHNLDIAVVTIKNNIFSTTEIFANKFYDENNMGLGNERDGILLVIDMKSRKFYILTNGFTHSLITDDRIELILDTMETNMENGDYALAIDEFLQNINKYYQYHKYGPPYLWIGAVVIAIIIATIALNHEKKKLKLISNELNANYYFVDKEIENKIDKHVNTRTSIIHNSNNSSSEGSSNDSGSRGGGERSF